MAYGSFTQRGGRTSTQTGSRSRQSSQNGSWPYKGTITETENGELQILCQHGEPALQLLSKSEKNPERLFWKCNRQADPCKSFLWDDEAPQEYEKLKRSGGGASLASSSQPRDTPVAAREAAATAAQARATSAAPLTPTASPSRGIIGRSSQQRLTVDLDDEPELVPNDDELDEIEAIEESPRKKAKFSFSQASNEAPQGSSPNPSQLFSQKSAQTPERGSTWDKIRDDPNSPFHARSEALRASFTPTSSQKSSQPLEAEYLSPTAPSTEDALRHLDGVEAAFGGSSPTTLAIRKALLTEQRKAKSATQQKDTLLALREHEIQRLQAENEALRKALGDRAANDILGKS